MLPCGTGIIDEQVEPGARDSTAQLLRIREAKPDLIFFDEPTTNMDAERRENLAMQISRITHFDQLFVISHDETFDSYVDNVVSVGN